MALLDFPPRRSSWIRRVQFEMIGALIFVHITTERRVTYVYRVTYRELNDFLAANSRGRYYNHVIKGKRRRARKY